MNNLKKGFIVPVLLVIIALLVVGGSVYVYESKKSEAPAVINTETQQSNQTQRQDNTPEPSIKNSITILSPNANTIWTTGETYQVKWTTSGIAMDSQGYILLKNTAQGGDYYVINKSVALNGGAASNYGGSRNYTVPVESLSFLPGKNVIRIGVGRYEDYNGAQSVYFDSAPFEIKGAVAKISVAGMKQYTDSNFGFSFWYPNTWTVQSTAIKNSYSGGSIQKTLTIAPASDPNGTSGEAITIDEFSSPTREITIPRDICSPMSGLSVPIHRYYFDTNTHTWMVEVPAYTGWSERDGSQYGVPASIKAADVSNNTMGGLHMLGAGCSGSVIPLSAKNFVVFLFNSRNAGPNYIELAKTITATDPSVAMSVSSGEQIQTITKAGVLLGAIGTKVGQWYVTNERVYNWRGDFIAGANPSTFRLIGTYSDGTTGASYATDGTHVYSPWLAESPVLSGADPVTFIAIKQQYQIPYVQSSGRYGESFTSYDTSFAKDKSHVWYLGKLIPGADPNTFVVTGNTHVENTTGGYTLAHDTNYSYGIDKKGELTIDGVTVP